MCLHVKLWVQEYEGAVEDRNHTGIMLIDRNDELCILYEKANAQEEVMRKGTVQTLSVHKYTCCMHFPLQTPAHPSLYYLLGKIT